MVTEGAAAHDAVTLVVDELTSALDEGAALTLQLEDARARRAELDDQLRRARDEASRSVIDSARAEIEQLVALADDRARSAEYDAAEQAARSGAERRALMARLDRIEASCEQLLAAVATLADAAREPTIIVDDRDPRPPARPRLHLFDRTRRVRAARRARADKAIAERISRVMAPSNGAIEAEAVEARIRNMSHGTNGI